VDKKHILNLIDKYLKGLASNEEEELLVQFFDSFKGDEVKDHASLMLIKEELEQKMLDRLLSSLKKVPTPIQDEIKVPSVSFWKYIAASAAIVALTISLYLSFSGSNKLPLIASVKKSALEPGGNKAQLKLGDGSIIELNNAANGVLAVQGSITVKKTKDGQLIYEPGSNDKTVKNTSNTITTPKGGQYQLTLPDGTKVWLNAASSLTFPTVFNGLERKVSLSGEAYFEVAKVSVRGVNGLKRMPFLVNTPESQVEVLGTHFNVMAYPDRINQQTTLLEGSVVVKHGAQSQKIIPGQQATIVYHSSASILVEKANMESVMAWKEGLFLFDGTSIEDAMQQIGLWYNAEVVYQGPKPDTEFTGVLPRSSDLNSVLDLLESAQGVQFRVNGGKIIVQKK